MGPRRNWPERIAITAKNCQRMKIEGVTERRKKLASLSFTEKVKILEKLRDRSLAFASSRKKLDNKKPAEKKA